MDGDSKKQQKRLGPAPIASFEKSFEDSSSPSMSGIASSSSSEKSKMDSGGGGPDESNPHNDKAIVRQQPSISVSTPSKKLHDTASKRPPPLQSVSTASSGDQVVHHPSSATLLGLTTPSTPRIDISRASSSSHHEDSRDSSPENVFEQVGTGTLQEAIGLGFREEGALELRSSTEELFFMDPEQKREEQEKMQQGMRCFIRSGMLGRKRNASSSLDAGWNTNTLWPQARKSSPVIFKFDEHQSYLQQHQRKDSASSEVAALLCISGRTSRISSVGSQGSAVSRLSAVSGVSRSPSPHRMLLETSFCGPKPLENVVDGSIISTVEPPTAEVLEQVLLSRKHDPTQAILAEGIKIENSPKKKPLTNGEAKAKSSAEKPVAIAKVSKPTVDTGIRSAPRKGLTALARRDSGKQVIGQTPSGTEYIRINLKPDHMYDDKGVAPHERVVDSATGTTAQKKPVSLSLGRDVASEQRLTPGSSPKPVRHAILSREIGGSRSPSPATVAISRKSSFCSLFKPKDSPDSPRDRSRSRSKSRDRGSTPQSQSGTPNKQKSVLAIFKPKRSGSKSKCSSPIDQDAVSQLDGISQVEFKFKSDTPEPRSRPASRLRYYDTPLDGKSIHIPLHTPPEEKSDRKFAPSQISKEPDPPPPQASPKEVHPPPPSRKSPSGLQGPPAQHPIETVAIIEQAPALPVKAPRPPQIEKIQRIENLDAIHTLPRDLNERERTWSLEVHRHSSQESQETVIMDNSAPTSRRISKPNLADVAEVPLKENGVPPIVPHASVIHQQTSQTPLNQIGDHVTREKRRLLFATRIGSGSQEQIFSTQFSLSKTESLSSQLSEQTSIPDSPAVEGREPLHRSDTVIRRPDDVVCMLQQQTQQQQQRRKDSLVESKPSSEESKPPSGALQKKDSSEDNKRKSKSTSEEEDKRPVIVMMRKKDSSEDNKRKSKSASEEDDSTNRHSRYIENFDPKKKFHESTRKQTSRNSSDSSIKERDSQTSSKEEPEMSFIPELPVKANKQDPNLALPQPPAERQSLISTDEPGESSESERDSEMDPNRIRRHLPRHIGAIEDHESTGLVSQDSFEDELPYVPTTLPEERAHGVALIPMKERVHMELKTCPVDRPRSTTPMNPACLEEYCGIVTPDDTENFLIRGEKLRISLPRKDSVRDKTQKTKSPRRISNASGKSWFEFAEQGIRGPTTTPAATTTPTHPNVERRDSKPDDEPPPPLPPRKPAAGQWINFENIPEKRKPPKRITALPREASQESYKALPPPVQYNYVKPEECQCECHEVERESAGHKSISSVDLLQQGEDLQPLLEPDPHEGIEPSDLTSEYAYGDENQETDNEQPERDLSERRSRSSGHSQDRDSPDQLLPSSSIRDSCRTKRDYRRP